MSKRGRPSAAALQIAAPVASVEARPDAEHVLRIDGRTEYRFTCSYRHQGRERSIELWAADWDDAEAQVSAIRRGLSVDGQVYAELRG